MMTAIEKAQKLFQTVGTFIISTIDDEGYPHTKAVVPGKYRDSLDELFFCTNTSSKFAKALAKEDKASVYFYSKVFLWRGCMLKGKMEIVEDMAIKKKYWSEAFKDAYPQKSFTDPDFCVLRFTPNEGRFYSNYKTESFILK